MTAGRIRRREIAWVVAALLAVATAIVAIVFLASSTAEDADGGSAPRSADLAAVRAGPERGSAASPPTSERRPRASASKDADANAPGGAADPPGGVRIGHSTAGRAADPPHAAPVAATTGTPTDSETATAMAKRDAAGSATSRATRIRTPQTFVVHVTAAESGRPVRAAAIDLHPREGEPIHAQTDGEGRAPFTLPPVVAFDLETKSRGRLRVRRDGVTAPAPDTVIEVALERGVVVKGSVRGPKGPIAAATVRAFELAPYLKAIPYDPDPRPVEETQTDRSGAYRLDCIPRGLACALVVEAEPFTASCDEIDPQPDPDYVLRRDVKLERGTLVRGS